MLFEGQAPSHLRSSATGRSGPCCKVALTTGQPRPLAAYWFARVLHRQELGPRRYPQEPLLPPVAQPAHQGFFNSSSREILDESAAFQLRIHSVPRQSSELLLQHHLASVPWPRLQVPEAGLLRLSKTSS